MAAEDPTLSYYAKNAEACSASTVDVDFPETQGRFSGPLPRPCASLGLGVWSSPKAILALAYNICNWQFLGNTREVFYVGNDY